MIRERREYDWPALMRLERCFPTIQRTCRRVYDIIVEDGAFCAIATHGGDYAVGCVWVEDDEITSLAVLPAYRGLGLADELLKAALVHIAECNYDEARLDVRPAAIAALRLYVRNGFVPSKFKPNYYGKREPSIEMVKSLG